jgi:hypothetical protein
MMVGSGLIETEPIFMSKLIFTLGRSLQSTEIELMPSEILAVRQLKTEGGKSHSRQVYTKTKGLLTVWDKDRRQKIPEATELLDRLGDKPFTTVGHIDAFDKLSYLELGRSNRIAISTDEADYGDIKIEKYSSHALGRIRLGAIFTEGTQWKNVDPGTRIHRAVLCLANEFKISVAHVDGVRLTRYGYAQPSRQIS